MSDVSGGVCSTASAAIVCVTVFLEDYPKSEAFFNGSRHHFPPSLSGMLTRRTLIIPSLLPVVQTLRTLRLRVFRTLKLFVLSDFESFGVADSSYFKTPSLSEFETLLTFRLRILSLIHI